MGARYCCCLAADGGACMCDEEIDEPQTETTEVPARGLPAVQAAQAAGNEAHRADEAE